MRLPIHAQHALIIRSLVIALLVLQPKPAGSQVSAASWLDNPKPVPWNKSGQSIPAAPRIQELLNPRCRQLARPPDLEEDKRLRDRGWDLFGTYEGGWQVVVIRGTSSYDGMCRPWQYQAFIFVHGVFAGTLSPQPMDSRSDGALSEVTLQSATRLIARYLRYAATDPRCCASRTTTVEFEISADGPNVQPVSAFTSPNK